MKKGNAHVKINNIHTSVINAMLETISVFRCKYSLDKVSLNTDYAGEILESVKNNRASLSCLSSLNAYDKYTFTHSINVFLLSIALGSALGLDKNRLHDLGNSALFHDIGKTLIPKKILNKKTMLTDFEFALIKTHTTKGYLYAKEKLSIPEASLPGILQHHEKYDGSGYPSRIKQENIDIFARIISIADVYDAITSDRPYRKAQSHTEAIEFIRYTSGANFDPEIAAMFTNEISFIQL